MGIIATELKRRKWSTFWWCVGIGLFVAFILAIYPSFSSSSAQLDKSLQNIPDSARELFTDTSDFLSPVGYLSSQCYYLLVPLLFSFLAIGLGSSLLAREEQNHTIELLLSRPLSRSQLLLQKAGAGLIITATVGLVTALVGGIMLEFITFDGVKPLSVFLVTIMALAFALLFGALAFMLTALGRFGRGASIGISTLLALGGYIIASLDKTLTWLAWPAKFLPFHYYHPADILRGHFTPGEFVGMLAVTLLLTGVALVAFRRRDIG